MMRIFKFIDVKVEKGKDIPHSRRYVLILMMLFVILLIIMTLLLLLRAGYL